MPPYRDMRRVVDLFVAQAETRGGGKMKVVRREPLDAPLAARPNQFVHLELEPYRQPLFNDPRRELSRVKTAADLVCRRCRREEDGLGLRVDLREHALREL